MGTGSDFLSCYGDVCLSGEKNNFLFVVTLPYINPGNTRLKKKGVFQFEFLSATNLIKIIKKICERKENLCSTYTVVLKQTSETVLNIKR